MKIHPGAVFALVLVLALTSTISLALQERAAVAGTADLLSFPARDSGASVLSPAELAQAANAEQAEVNRVKHDDLEQMASEAGTHPDRGEMILYLGLRADGWHVGVMDMNEMRGSNPKPEHVHRRGLRR